MKRTTRSTNLSLIRYLNQGHENTAKKLISLTNSNYLSKMATDHMEISDHVAKKIETILKMPERWLDRDNFALITMTAIDSDIYQATKALPEVSKTALLAFIKTLKIDTGV